MKLMNNYLLNHYPAIYINLCVWPGFKLELAI
jgi:hypothetical protein